LDLGITGVNVVGEWGISQNGPNKRNNEL